MKKILILGGNQFVGKAITKRLLEKDYDIYVLNRGTKENLKNAVHIKCDRNNIDEMKNSLKNFYVDIIIDVSAYTQSQVNIIQNAMLNRFKQYILISSASIYNDVTTYPIKENDSIGENIIWGNYAKDKFLAEVETINNSKLHNFKYTIFRPFYIYGIGNNHDRENYIFSRIKYDLPIFLPNKGDNIVQFGYIDDLVDGILMSFENEKFYNEIFNISGDECVTFSKLVNLCGEIMDKKVDIRYISTFNNEIKARDWFPFRDIHLFGDISKIKEKGFCNKYSLRKGLKEIYEYNNKNNLIIKPSLNKLELLK